MAYDLTSTYDENLMENIFFQTLQTQFNELFLKAISEGCIICVPRVDSLSRYLLTLEDFLTHILMPTDELPESHFRNLCGAEIKISNKIVNVDHAVGRQSSIHILFQETFYTKDGFKYEVLCVEQPFDGDLNKSKSGIVVINSLRDCLDLLWTETGNHETIENIDKEISEFLKKNSTIDTSSLHVIKNSVDALYNKCLQILLKNSNVKKKQKTQKHTLNNLKISVEAYMQHGIYKKIMKGISTCTAVEDAQLNKIIRNFSDLHFQDFNIKTEFHNSIPKARLELSRINCYSTTLGKIGCLRRTVVVLSDPHFDHPVLSAEDLLQILAFLIIKTNLPNWNAQLKFLKLFQLSNHDECSFLIATLEAAILYVQSGIFFQGNKEDNSEVKTKHEESLKNCEIQSLKQINEKASVKEKTIHQFFHQIALGNLEKVKQMLENPPKSPENYSLLNLCHPLCTCEKCSLIIHKTEKDIALDVNVCDDQGLTGLHIASMYGIPNAVEYLLACNADPNACDCDGKAPVHYAALRGHQNALLLLIHNDAEINIVDNSSNTPLHLCANNGHESCVKALIYFSEYLGVKLKVNHQNIRGDTPLHNASKWGYIGIVRILLEYGANPTILNKQKFSPIDLAHNVKVSELLKQKCTSVTNFIKIKSLNPVLDLYDQGSSNSSNQIYKGIQPSSTEMIKQVEKVLQAIKNGDINLVCFYLGIDVSEFEQSPVNSQLELNTTNKCHPLCVCSKCGTPELKLQNGTKQSKKKGLNINVCNVEGYTPLHIAAKYGHLDIVRGLIRNGGLLNGQTSKLVTPLMLACQNQKITVVKELLDSGCQIDMQDCRLNTALHYACYTGNSKLIEVLLKYEPNISLKNIENKTVLKIAKEKMSLGIIQVLKGGKPFDLKEL